MITEQITIYASIDQIEPDGDVQSLMLSNFDLNQILAEFNTQEILEALTAADKFNDIVEYTTKELEEKNESLV